MMTQCDFPADEEIKAQYKGFRKVRIVRDDDSVTVSYDTPCLVCGKYHHKKKDGLGYRSKIGKEHHMIHIVELIRVVGDE